VRFGTVDAAVEGVTVVTIVVKPVIKQSRRSRSMTVQFLTGAKPRTASGTSSFSSASPQAAHCHTERWSGTCISDSQISAVRERLANRPGAAAQVP
jgi:hypothetical protein